MPKKKKINVNEEALSIDMADLSLQEQNIESTVTAEAIASVSHFNEDYNHYALNFVISNSVANNPNIRFIRIGESQNLQINLQEFRDNLLQTRAIIPIRPERNGQEIQHFTGLYIERINDNQFRIAYVDPVGSGAISDIPQTIRNHLTQILDVSMEQIISTTNQVQHRELRSGIISNHHCGPFTAEILTQLALGTISISGDRLQQLTSRGEWQNIADLGEAASNNNGIRLREQHLELLEGAKINYVDNIEMDNIYFPRCEYYARFKATTHFDMDIPDYWRTYFRSTTRGGGCDRYAKEFKDSQKTYGNLDINPENTKQHAKSGAFVSPFFHKKYSNIVLKVPKQKKQNSSNFLYDDILKYKQSLCITLKSRIDNSHFEKVIATYANEYPCIMISLKGITEKNGKISIDSWYKMLMSYYVAIVNKISSNAGIAIELVLRSSFGHNLPSVDSTEESFRINIGLIPKIYLDILLEGLKHLNSNVVPALEKGIIPADVLQEMNTRIQEYNQRERVTLPKWTKDLFKTFNLQGVKNKPKISVLNEIIARDRGYPDLLIDLIMENLEVGIVDYVKPLIEMLKMLDYSSSSITLNTSNFQYSYKKQKNKLKFPKIVKSIDDKEFWDLLTHISLSLGAKGKLVDLIKYKKLEGIYAALEEANLNFIRNSGYQDTDDGIGSDSDCEVEPNPADDIPQIYSRKIIVATGMRAINVAAFLAFQDIISSADRYGIDTKHMYFETEDAIENISNVMVQIFKIRKDNRNKKVGKILFFDLNKCEIQPINSSTDLETKLNNVGLDFPVILDYTSATTEQIGTAILKCLKKTKTVLLVNSGLKNEQMGSDINPYGTIRIVSTEQNKMLNLYYLAKGVLTEGGYKDILPKVAHQIRKSYKDSGFTVTSKNIYKSYYKARKNLQIEVTKSHPYWDFIRHSEEIRMLLDNGFTREQILALRNNNRPVFLRFIDVVPTLLEEEDILEKDYILSLFNTQDPLILVEFFEWLNEEVYENDISGLDLDEIETLISLFNNHRQELTNIVNYHEVAFRNVVAWDSDEVENLGTSEVLDITRQDEVTVDDLRDYYENDKEATIRVIKYWEERKTERSFDDLWKAITNKERNEDSEEDAWDDDTLEAHENEAIEDGCPDGWFPRGYFGSDSDRDSDEDVGNEDYDNEEYESGDSYEEDNRYNDYQHSDYSNESVSLYYVTNIVYDNPEFIESLLYRKPLEDNFFNNFKLSNESKKCIKSDFYIKTYNSVNPQIIAEPTSFLPKQVSNYQYWAKKNADRISDYSSHNISFFKESELEYLNPLSDEYKELVQEWHEVENMNIISSIDNNVMAAILGGILFQFSNFYI